MPGVFLTHCTCSCPKTPKPTTKRVTKAFFTRIVSITTTQLLQLERLEDKNQEFDSSNAIWTIHKMYCESGRDNCSRATRILGFVCEICCDDDEEATSQMTSI